MNLFSAAFLVLAVWIVSAAESAGQSSAATREVSNEEEKKAAIAVVLAHEQAVQSYDFDKVDALHTADSRGIEESYPEPRRKRNYIGVFKPLKDAGVHIDYHPQDAVAEVQGDVAWVTVTMHSVWTADTPAGRELLAGNEWRATFVESWVLVKTPEGWKIALGHTSQVPPDLGVEVDYQRVHGGVRFAEVPENRPAGKAGIKSGDVLIEYGGQKIDNPDDLYRLRYAHYEGRKVSVTVMRGKEKLAREVTLEAMK
ncbi:MAG: PDZ domain-containing protein [Gammaproteobacteria bacterium]|nr:PDZ domain-containing protein [Gammaproteobacteria bacterium]